MDQIQPDIHSQIQQIKSSNPEAQQSNMKIVKGN